MGGGFRIYFNWRPLKNHFMSKARGGLNLKKELIVCLAIAVWVITSSILKILPLSCVIDLREYVKASRIVTTEYETPFGHAELLALNAFGTKLSIPIKEALGELQKHGVRVQRPQQPVAEIAKNNELKPMNLHGLISHLEPQVASPAGVSAMTPEMVEEKLKG
jgi:hypothetical protein